MADPVDCDCSDDKISINVCLTTVLLYLCRLYVVTIVHTVCLLDWTLQLLLTTAENWLADTTEFLILIILVTNQYV